MPTQGQTGHGDEEEHLVPPPAPENHFQCYVQYHHILSIIISIHSLFLISFFSRPWQYIQAAEVFSSPGIVRSEGWLFCRCALAAVLLHPRCSVTAPPLQRYCIAFAASLHPLCSKSSASSRQEKCQSGFYSRFITSAGLTCAARHTCHITVSSDSRAVMRKATTNSPGVSGALWAKPCK